MMDSESPGLDSLILLSPFLGGSYNCRELKLLVHVAMLMNMMVLLSALIEAGPFEALFWNILSLSEQ